MSAPYRGLKLPSCRWNSAFAALLALQASARLEPEQRVGRQAESAFAHEPNRPLRSAVAPSKHTSSAARTGTAVGRTSFSFSDPHPQAPPALWGTGTTGGTLGHTRGMTIRSG